MAGEVRVTQVGVLIETGESPPRVSQAGAVLDVDRSTPPRVSQAGAVLDVDRSTPPRVSQAGVTLDARYRRAVLAHDCLEIHVEDVVGRYLAQLDGAFDVAYLATLSGAGGGQFKMHANDPKATPAHLAAGNFVRVRYHNVDIGAWVIEALDTPLVGDSEEAGRIITVSGRGLLGLLEEGIVYPGDLDDPAHTAERQFAGVTKASILLALYNEFVDRGGGALNLGFTAERASDGKAWTDAATINFRSGQTLLDVARTLAGLGLELIVAPDRTLEAYDTAGTDRSGTIVFRAGQTIRNAGRATEAGRIATVVLGEGQGCYVESRDAPALSTYRRREYHLSVKNTLDTAQVEIANRMLLDGYKAPREAYELEVSTDPWRPWLDYGVGDVVRVDIPGAVENDFRVLAISVVTKSGPCDLQVTLELKDLHTEYLQRTQRAFEASLQGVQPGPGAAAGLATAMTETPVGGSGSGLKHGSINKWHLHRGVHLADEPQETWGFNNPTGLIDAQDIPFFDTWYAFDMGRDTVSAAFAALAQRFHSPVSVQDSAAPVIEFPELEWQDDSGTRPLIPLPGQALGLKAQPANTVLAGPTSGADAAPTFRPISTITDLPGVLLADGSRPLTGNLNFAQYKAVAMVCDNGAAFPGSPAAGQWYYRSDLDTLFMFEGVWRAVTNFAALNLYVDQALGSNAVGQGYAPGTGATATVSYALTLVPPVLGGDVMVNIAAGTYAIESLAIPTYIGAGRLYVVGALTVHETGALTSVTRSLNASGGSRRISTVSGGSTSVSVSGTAVNLYVGSVIIANGETRIVVSKASDSSYTVDRAVDWYNAGAGYAYTFTHYVAIKTAASWTDNEHVDRFIEFNGNSALTFGVRNNGSNWLALATTGLSVGAGASYRIISPATILAPSQISALTNVTLRYLAFDLSSLGGTYAMQVSPGYRSDIDCCRFYNGSTKVPLQGVGAFLLSRCLASGVLRLIQAATTAVGPFTVLDCWYKGADTAVYAVDGASYAITLTRGFFESSDAAKPLIDLGAANGVFMSVAAHTIFVCSSASAGTNVISSTGFAPVKFTTPIPLVNLQGMIDIYTTLDARYTNANGDIMTGPVALTNTSVPAAATDTAAVCAADQNSEAGNAGLHIRAESGERYSFADRAAFGAGIQLPVVSKTTTYTATLQDYAIICLAAAGDWTLSLPAASTAYNTAEGAGLVLCIRNKPGSSDDVIVDGDSGETIDGATTQPLTPGDGIIIVCDGSEWHIIGRA